MDSKRFYEPSFLAAAINCLLLLVLLSYSGRSTTQKTTGELIDLRSELQELKVAIKVLDDRIAASNSRLTKSPEFVELKAANAGLANLESSVTKLQKMVDMSPALAAIKAVDVRLDGLASTVSKVQQTIDMSSDTQTDRDSTTFELHTKAEVEKLIDALGKVPTAERLAECIAQLDGWNTKPEDSEAVQALKLHQLLKLRQSIVKEMTDLHEKALNSKIGSDATEVHARASQILALYPMDSSKEVLNEARKLSSRHSEVGAKIEVIRRLRYNAWAMERIEGMIDAVNSIATSFKTSDNPKTIDATVEYLGEVDPLLLEPVVAQLFNFAIEQAKGHVSSKEQLTLGKRLIDPSIKRKGFGDF
jgi:hypothetical protein